MRVLVVEDDRTLAAFVAQGLQEAGLPSTRPPTEPKAYISP